MGAKIKDEEEDSSLSDLQDKQRSGKPSLAIDPANSARVKELIRDDRRVSIDDIAERLEISHGRTAKILGELGFAKICARWVPRQLTYAHKQARLGACLKLLESHARDKTFLK